MQETKILILHKNSHILEKLAQNLRNSGYSTIIASNVDTTLNLAFSLKPELILWGEALSVKNKEAIQQLKTSEYGNDHSIIVIAENIELFDRIDAEKYGVDDFCSANSDYSELKSRIHFHINHMRQIRLNRIKSEQFKKLADINYNIMLCQDIYSLCELVNDFLLKYYDINFLTLAVYNTASKNFDYFNVLTPNNKKKINIENIKNHEIWRNYFFNGEKLPESEEITDTELLGNIYDFNLNYDRIYQFPLIFGGKNLGILLISWTRDLQVDSEDMQILNNLTRTLALRIHEIKRIVGKDREGAAEGKVIRELFNKLSEDEILTYLSRNLLKILQAEQCIYMNYNEGFQFISPKFLYKSDVDENLFEKEVPPVLLIKDFPTLESLLNNRRYVIFETAEKDLYRDLDKLTTIKDADFKNIIIFPLWYTNTIQGFFLLGNTNVFKKYSDREIIDCEQFIKNAATILEENRILKQANLTIKQLDRIFELSTELTLDTPLSEILKKITTAIRRTLGWNIVILDRKSGFNDHYKTINVLGMKEDDYNKYINDKNYPHFKTRINKCFTISRSYLYDHIRSKLDDREKATEEFAMHIGTAWNDNDWVYVPIESRGKLLGMISLNDPVDRKRPDKEKIRSIEYFANQAAVLIENIELFESLKSSELKYRMLAETMIMGLVTCNFNGKIIYINNSLADMLKYPGKEKLLNKKIYSICESDSAHKLQKEIVSIVKDAQKEEGKVNDVSKGIELEMIALDGEKIPFMIYISSYLQENHRASSVLRT